MPSSTRSLRADVQALRAVAVCGVVLFHIWPHAIRGGYAGVDVFFVISGYLITAHLIGEVAREGHIELRAFWARRIRRLLPAALLVLAASVIATFAILPSSLWTVHFREIMASALYAENWLLAADSVDYLNSENDPSVAQHYWSLAVEEQFYLFWPLLMTGVLALTGGRPSLRIRGLRLLATVVLVTSLTTSVVLTASDPGPAYFVTHTRAWEFALGALVALVSAARIPDLIPHTHLQTRGLARLVGWLMIVDTLLLYTTKTPFPSWTALFPTLGTALVIWAGEPPRSTLPGRISALRPVQFLGQISYSLYLWHWPLIVLGGYLVDGVHGVVGGSAIFALGVVLAALTNRYVEDPVRFHPRLLRSLSLTYGSGLVAGLAVAAVAYAGLQMVHAEEKASVEQTERILHGDSRCFGADATIGADVPCRNPDLAEVLLPQPAALLGDTGAAYSCYDTNPRARLRSCVIGPRRHPRLRIALVGDSHAASLTPGLRDQADRLGWRIDTYVGHGCGWTTTGPDDPCQAHRTALQKRLTLGPRYDVVLVTLHRDGPWPGGGASDDPEAARMAQAWAPALARGTRVIALADNPTMPAATIDCVERAETQNDFAGCTASRADGFAAHDPLPAAVELANQWADTQPHAAHASLIDFSRAYCDDTTCPTLIGHVIAYRDGHHLTATFSRTLAPFLVAEIQRIAQPSNASTKASGSKGARSSGPSPRPTNFTGTPSSR